METLLILKIRNWRNQPLHSAKQAKPSLPCYIATEKKPASRTRGRHRQKERQERSRGISQEGLLNNRKWVARGCRSCETTCPRASLTPRVEFAAVNVNLGIRLAPPPLGAPRSSRERTDAWYGSPRAWSLNIQDIFGRGMTISLRGRDTNSFSCGVPPAVLLFLNVDVYAAGILIVWWMQILFRGMTLIRVGWCFVIKVVDNGKFYWVMWSSKRFLFFLLPNTSIGLFPGSVAFTVCIASVFIVPLIKTNICNNLGIQYNMMGGTCTNHVFKYNMHFIYLVLRKC